MAVTREDVRWAYRMLLGREAESEQVVDSHLSTESIEQLRLMFMNSAEFQASIFRQNPIGKYVNHSKQDIQLDCSEDEIQRMLSRISREWKKFGEEEAHWSVMTGDEFLSDSIEKNIEEFYATALSDITQIISAVRRVYPSHTRFKRVLDFGCGVGRLSLAMSSVADSIIGIDISPPHLVWAKDRADQINADNVEFISITAIDDLDRFKDFDLVYSLIVLQHNPPPVMAALFRSLLGCLGSGGIAIIQIPTYLEGQSFSIDGYFAEDQPPMEMNALPQDYVFDLIEQAGCRVLEVREDGRIGEIGLSHVFVVLRK